MWQLSAAASAKLLHSIIVAPSADNPRRRRIQSTDGMVTNERKPKYSEKSSSHCHSVHHKSHPACVGEVLSLRREQPEINRHINIHYCVRNRSRNDNAKSNAFTKRTAFSDGYQQDGANMCHEYYASWRKSLERIFMKFDTQELYSNCELRYSGGGDYEQRHYLLCYAMRSGRKFPTFRRNVLPPFAGCLSTLKLEIVYSSETSVDFVHTTRHYDEQDNTLLTKNFLSVLILDKIGQ